MRQPKRIIIVAGVVLGLLVLFPLAVGAVTQPDAIAGLLEVLSNMTQALRATLEGMVDAYSTYLGSL